jgi:hypothetical protein
MRTESGARARGKWILGIAMAGAVLLIPPVQRRFDARMEHATADPDILYFSSPRAVKALAMSFDNLVADVYWMRAIQYYGRREEAARRKMPYKNLAALLDIVTTLDPKMLDVYRAGSVFLAEPEPLGAGKPEASIQLLDKGIALLPQDWRLCYDKGFVYFLYLKDYQKAGQAWIDGSRIQGAPPWLEGLAATSLLQGGALETAKSLWRRQLEEATRADLKDNARNHLDSIQVDEDIWTLEFFLEKYAAVRYGFPARLDDLVVAGYLRYIPVDPSGVPYQYFSATGAVSLSPESKVRYLTLTYSYRDTFKANLEQLYGSKRRL